MFLRLLILFTVVPLVELALLIRLGQAISLGPTMGIIILTGVVGAALARHQGLRTLARIQQDMLAGRLPTGSMVDGLLILVAAALLVTPGLLTDAAGFALLIPPARRRLRASLGRYFEKRITVVHSSTRGPHQSAPDEPDFIDVEAEEAPERSDRDDSQT